MHSRILQKVKKSVILRTFGLLFLFTMLLAGGFSIYQKVLAQGTGAVTGFAWSSTVGWISFSCSDRSVCGTSNYGVQVDPTTGIFSGYAWSSNVGWIKFSSSMTNCPVAGQCTPRIDLTTGAVTGFARACGGTLAGNCIDQTDYANWDGWIQLSGTNFPSIQPNGLSGVTYVSSTGKLVGYAWGGISTMGWIQFNPIYGGGVSIDLDQTCTLLGNSYPDGSTIQYYPVDKVTDLADCGGISATCNSGTWSTDVSAINASWSLSCDLITIVNECEEWGNNACVTPSGGIMGCAESKTFYKKKAIIQNASSTATCNDNGNSMVRTCINTETTAELTGDSSYIYETCRVNPGVKEK